MTINNIRIIKFLLKNCAISEFSKDVYKITGITTEITKNEKIKIFKFLALL